MPNAATNYKSCLSAEVLRACRSASRVQGQSRIIHFKASKIGIEMLFFISCNADPFQNGKNIFAQRRQARKERPDHPGFQAKSHEFLCVLCGFA